jgi:hypothetical protein
MFYIYFFYLLKKYRRREERSPSGRQQFLFVPEATEPAPTTAEVLRVFVFCDGGGGGGRDGALYQEECRHQEEEGKVVLHRVERR